MAGDFAIGHYTHEKNPVTARAALETINVIEEEGLVARSAELGAWSMDQLKNDIGNHPNVRDIRGRGLMFGVELRDPAHAEQVYYACLEAGVSFKISAGNVLTLSPPLTIARDDLERALGIVSHAIKGLT